MTLRIWTKRYGLHGDGNGGDEKISTRKEKPKDVKLTQLKQTNKTINRKNH